MNSPDIASLRDAERRMAGAVAPLEELGLEGLAKDLSCPRAADCLFLPASDASPPPCPSGCLDPFRSALVAARDRFHSVSGPSTPAEFARAYPPASPRDTYALRAAALASIAKWLVPARQALRAHGAAREAWALHAIIRKIRRASRAAKDNAAAASADLESCTWEVALLRLLAAGG
jgi:hypothetical protein